MNPRLVVLGTCLAMLMIAAPLASAAEGTVSSPRTECVTTSPLVNYLACCPINHVLHGTPELIPTCYL